MKRRTLDILFSIGGLGIAGLLVVMGAVLTSNSNFSHRYVTDQLTQQQITFKAADKLTEEERQSACLVENAGKLLTTGKQAECYANEFIGLHVKNSGKGLTYSQWGDVQTQLRAQIATAQQNDDPNLPALQKELADATATRETVFKGETLRGVLLTSYGFSVLGEKGAQGATVAYVAAALLTLLSIAGFVHALVTPKTKAFAAPEAVATNGAAKVPTAA
jgi:hypothetical protein